MGLLTLAAGSRWRSTVCETEVVVTRAVPEPVDLRCGGAPMVGVGDETAPNGAGPDPALAGGTLLGKRYASDELQLLCTRAGQGTLSIGDAPLEIAQPKHLPASD